MRLEIQFQTKLKLPRIKRCGWTAVEASIAGAFFEEVYVVDKRRRSCLVESIEEIEALQPQKNGRPF